MPNLVWHIAKKCLQPTFLKYAKIGQFSEICQTLKSYSQAIQNMPNLCFLAEKRPTWQPCWTLWLYRMQAVYTTHVPTVFDSIFALGRCRCIRGWLLSAKPIGYSTTHLRLCIKAASVKGSMSDLYFDSIKTKKKTPKRASIWQNLSIALQVTEGWFLIAKSAML